MAHTNMWKRTARADLRVLTRARTFFASTTGRAVSPREKRAWNPCAHFRRKQDTAAG
jgi:hypothetical protein